MKATTNNQLSCSVFGHNLERLSKDSYELTCKTCKSKIALDNSDKIETVPFKNQNIKMALRQLYLLQNRYATQRLTV
jgi:hypothetical protein